MRRLKIFLFVLLSVAVLLTARFIVFMFSVYITPPVPENPEILQTERIQIDENAYLCLNNWLRLSESGLWEMYIEGDAFERGAMKGILTRELICEQEKAFISEIEKLVPSRFYLYFLKYFIAWFNKDVTDYLPIEYQLEIFGVSESACEEFDNVGPSYLRFLNYHGAHDIGHSLQNMGMVGCTSFAVWDDASEDSLLMIGRNFDFYVGDDFAKNKIVAFYNPDQGHRFMFITWGGMTGVVSGMNEHGLTVTINAAASGIPLRAKTPVSLVAREVLQYARNIEEAYDIISKRETFVSESFFIGSALDHKAVIIEKNITETHIFESAGNTIICANHFQACAFEQNELNVKSIQTSSSPYRQQRVEELISELMPFNYEKAAILLRDRKGLNGKHIGYGNEKAVNQLIAHHSVIFIPARLQVWVSTPPYQLGKYVAYDLGKVFETDLRTSGNAEIYIPELTIPADQFLFTENFRNYEEYRKLTPVFAEKTACRNCNLVSEEFIEYYISLNPEYYYLYELTGDYYRSRKQFALAVSYYEFALTKEITTTRDKLNIQTKLEECKRKML